MDVPQSPSTVVSNNKRKHAATKDAQPERKSDPPRKLNSTQQNSKVGYGRGGKGGTKQPKKGKHPQNIDSTARNDYESKVWDVPLSTSSSALNIQEPPLTTWLRDDVDEHCNIFRKISLLTL